MNLNIQNNTIAPSITIEDAAKRLGLVARKNKKPLKIQLTSGDFRIDPDRVGKARNPVRWYGATMNVPSITSINIEDEAYTLIYNEGAGLMRNIPLTRGGTFSEFSRTDIWIEKGVLTVSPDSNPRLWYFLKMHHGNVDNPHRPAGSTDIFKEIRPIEVQKAHALSGFVKRNKAETAVMLAPIDRVKVIASRLGVMVNQDEAGIKHDVIMRLQERNEGGDNKKMGYDEVMRLLDSPVIDLRAKLETAQVKGALKYKTSERAWYKQAVDGSEERFLVVPVTEDDHLKPLVDRAITDPEFSTWLGFVTDKAPAKPKTTAPPKAAAKEKEKENEKNPEPTAVIEEEGTEPSDSRRS